MTRQMPGGAQVAFARDWFERQGIPAETIDVTSYIDRSLTYEENIKNLRRQFGVGKLGMDAPKVARGLTAAECDVAIGNFEAGYNHQVTKDACRCGHTDACEKLERQRAEKAAAKRQPAATEPTATEVAWQAVNARHQAAEARRTAATAKPKAAKQDVTLKTIGGRFHLCRAGSEPVEILVDEAYEFVCRKVLKDLAGKRVSEKKLREYADKHGFYGGWVESAYDAIKPSRSIESIERDIKKVDEQAYKRSMASRAHGGTRPGGGAMDRDLQRIWERGSALKAELERAKSQKQGATPAAAKPNLKTVKDVEQWIEKKTREYGSRNEFVCSSEYADMYPEITRAYNQAEKQKKEELKRVNIVKNPDGTGFIIKIISKKNAYVGGAGPMGMGADIATFETVEKAVKEAKRMGKTVVAKPREQPPARKPAPTPSVPPILTAPPELAADVLGAGMGLPPTQATKPKRKPAARTAKKQPKKTAAAKTRKTTKKTTTTPKLTASQREYLAINGFVMVKRGGKYVRITG